MKRLMVPVLTLLVLAMVSVPLFAQADFAVGKADEFITAMSRGDFQKAYGMLDSNLGFNTTADRWNKLWGQLTGKAGKFVEFRKHDVQAGNGCQVVVQVCKFEKGLVDLHVAVNNQGQIAGFIIKDHKAPPPSAAPPAEGKPEASTSAPPSDQPQASRSPSDAAAEAAQGGA